MANIVSQPSSPVEWEQYANSDVLSTIPATSNEREENGNTTIRRGVYLDVSAELKSPEQILYIYSDVLAFKEQEIVISRPDYSVTQLFARVFTAATPVNIKFEVPKEAAGYGVWIYVDILDQPITVSAGSSKAELLELGPKSENRGVSLTVSPNEVVPVYKPSFDYQPNQDFQSNLETQLRIALVLFWSNTSIAISLCAYVAKASASQPAYSQINTQAVALGQQLAVQTMTGPNMGYAPVLLLDVYKDIVHDALDAASAFEEQWQRFQDSISGIEVQKEAWETMLKLMINDKGRGKLSSDLAFEKYQYACYVVASSHQQLDADIPEIDEAKAVFQKGIEVWEAEQRFKALFTIFGAIIKFVTGIIAICDGNPAGVGDIVDAIDQVSETETVADQDGKVISSGTMKTLGDGMNALEKLYPATETVVQAVQQLESDRDTEIPSIDDISGTSQGDADAATIVALAGWDKWVLESDQQLEFAVGETIGGASEYRLVLRKHSVNGKQLAQAQAEAIKAGQEYIQAEMDVIVSKQDINDLQDLLNEFAGDEEIYAQAEAKLFDRFLALRTSVAIEMRNMVWAYKYWALRDSRVDLDSQKSTAEFRADFLLLDTEIETASTTHASDFQPFEFVVPSEKLPSNYGPLMVQGLQSESHSATFTLEPASSSYNDQSFASKFVDGSHFRLEGLEAVLRGAVPQSHAIENGVVQVDLQISTSGVYADVQDGEVYHFTSQPRSVRFSYYLAESGDRRGTLIRASFPTEKYTDFTPFTQWTIELLHPELLDLHGLIGVDLIWTGHARFDEPFGRKMVKLPKRKSRMQRAVHASSRFP